MIRGADTSLPEAEESVMRHDNDSGHNDSRSAQFWRVHFLKVEQDDRVSSLLGRAPEAGVEAGCARVKQWRFRFECFMSPLLTGSCSASEHVKVPEVDICWERCAGPFDGSGKCAAVE